MNELVKLFEENKEVIRHTGWVITDPKSYEWWDGFDSADKIVISAFLVQLTKWESVKRVIGALEEHGLAKVDSIAELDLPTLESYFRPINFYRTKARRVLNFAKFVKEMGGLDKVLLLERRPLLLTQEGVGEETADSILLFAGHQLVFPNTEYSRRVLGRVTGQEMRKRDLPNFVYHNVQQDLYLYKILHAGLGAVGKAFCLLTKPKCDRCFLKQVCEYNYR
ncbi:MULTISPECIES: endonuclease III domain-containing protein [Metallosphaera]|uniref:endonuclease III domain-containing protein n=1 Tax=Metallosphaera TaxID=41980 RepID=UPI001F05DDCE|nr:endonuclease III domain-containing protein [Metallosphaera sedula]MCH1770038.1 endonuclease III domain-containing protein [Metallosphaera sedula]MCP6728128.1 endonuclease III domain-containing protein [Metallosphaera sedula]